MDKGFAILQQLLQTKMVQLVSKYSKTGLGQLLEKIIKMAGTYLNNPMHKAIPKAMNYAFPGTFVSQIDYTGSTNIYSPLLQLGSSSGEKFQNTNDPDNFFHL